MANVIEIKVPDIGDFKNIPVIDVLVKPGDSVNKEDPLVTLESDKATMDVPAPQAGVVKELRVRKGDKVSEGSPILTLEASEGAAAAVPAVKAPAATLVLRIALLLGALLMLLALSGLGLFFAPYQLTRRLVRAGELIGIDLVSGPFRRLRGEWRFSGFVVSDCGAIDDMYLRHRLVQTAPQAAALGVRSGTDLDCGRVYPNLVDAVRQGLIAEAQIDTSLTRLLLARMRLGMFDSPDSVRWARIPIGVLDQPSHRALALDVAVLAFGFVSLSALDPLDVSQLEALPVDFIELDENFVLVETRAPEEMVGLTLAEARYLRAECLGRGRATAWSQPFWLEEAER